ncbi:hypothetical protein P7K49_018583 [Saguinus oedipus]|uniref:Uncharacterized protein n=1 Tax=Saguinus oedipus TaxID=9490 RepID=A0ABQ9V693_SAGOE|nr:hypothetical protein P7K49_018583 [Saguinus oedipus]
MRDSTVIIHSRDKDQGKPQPCSFCKQLKNDGSQPARQCSQKHATSSNTTPKEPPSTQCSRCSRDFRFNEACMTVSEAANLSINKEVAREYSHSDV